MNDFTYINAREITRKENKENERQPIYVFSKREYVIECWNLTQTKDFILNN